MTECVPRARARTLLGMAQADTLHTLVTPNFRLGELTFSQTATRLGLRNRAGLLECQELEQTAWLLEDVRKLLGDVPIKISSGLRVLAVNRAVGSNDDSAHVWGGAVDFTAPDFGTPQQVARRIAGSHLQFDQLIFEGSWVHLGRAKAGQANRRELLTAVFVPGQKTIYQRGIT